MQTITTALSAFRRSPLLSALSVTTIACSLFAFGLFALVAVNLRQALDAVEDRVEVRAFASDNTPVEELAAAARQISDYPEVLSVEVVTKAQALARARTELGEFKDVFEADFLPPSLDIHVRPGFRDPETVSRFANQLQLRFDFIDDVRFGEEWITQLYRIRTIAGIAGGALGLAFAGVALIIIGTTIRMAVLARAREIAIMRLVGATDGYIRRPFLVEGLIKGILGGVLALGMIWGALQAIERYLDFKVVFFDQRTLLLGVLFGAALGFLGSVLSVGRQLRRV
jgi:cell division transport system permease protein